jgi:hypothetical protein
MQKGKLVKTNGERMSWQKAGNKNGWQMGMDGVEREGGGVHLSQLSGTIPSLPILGA